jgi:hypothetical protein
VFSERADGEQNGVPLGRRASPCFLFLKRINFTSVANPDPHHVARSGSGILEADPDPRLHNWHLINLFSVEKKYCE